MSAPKYPLGFSAAHRRAICILLAALILYLGLRLMRDRTFIDDPQPIRALRQHELADRIDPNVADLPTLSALPGLGDKRAADIIAYRDAAARRDPSRPPFAKLEDLLRIRGIGYSMMLQLAPHLRFPESGTTAPATGPGE